MEKNRKNAFLMAAVAGIAVGLSTPAPLNAQENTGDVHCYGVNGCGANAKCAVKADDVAAVRALLGNKEFNKSFGKTKEHSCAAHASCGASFHILNWTPATGDACHEQGGIVIEETDGKKVARKA